MYSLTEAILLPPAAETSHSYPHNEAEKQATSDKRPWATHSVTAARSLKTHGSGVRGGWAPGVSGKQGPRALPCCQPPWCQIGSSRPAHTSNVPCLWGLTSTHSWVSRMISWPRANPALLGITPYLSCSQAIRNPCPSVERWMEILPEFYGEAHTVL